jgi:hypothetical protein
MATTENRVPPPTGAESEFDRGVGRAAPRSRYQASDSQSSPSMWIYVLVAVAILGGGYYYYANYYSATSMTPTITETAPAQPEAVVPPAVPSEPAPALTPEPAPTPAPAPVPPATP